MPSRNLLLRSFGEGQAALKAHLTPVAFRAGQILAEPGERFDRVFFPVSGLISARLDFESGHELECGLIGWTNALGVIPALGQGVSLTRVVCLTDLHAWKLESTHLRQAMRANSQVDEAMQRFAGAQVAYAVRVGACNTMHRVDERLARWLTIASDLLSKPEIPRAQEELAKALGVQRTALNPALQKLKSEGMLEVGRGWVRILQPDRLRQRSCECTEPLRRAIFVEAPAWL